MVVWLELTAEEVLGADIASDLDADTFEVHVESVKSYIEDRRPDLLVPAAEEDGAPVFTPPRFVEFAATLLAYRCYLSRTTPASELGSDDSLAAMLGIRQHRRFGFGGAA